jgi:hypothetical protein
MWKAHALGLAPVDVIGGVVCLPKFPFLGLSLEGRDTFGFFMDLPLLTGQDHWVSVTPQISRQECDISGLGAF